MTRSRVGSEVAGQQVVTSMVVQSGFGACCQVRVTQGSVDIALKSLSLS